MPVELEWHSTLPILQATYTGVLSWAEYDAMVDRRQAIVDMGPDQFVLLAELAVLGSTIAAGVLDVGPNTRGMLYAAAVASCGIAVVGNIQVAIPHSGGAFDWFTAWLRALKSEPFSWFEAIAPPVFTLIAGLVLKEVALETIQRRHANERAYQQALLEWKEATADPEEHAHFRVAYAHALRTKLQSVNGKGRGQKERREVMQYMTDEHWRALVWRELKADQWLDAPGDDIIAPAIVATSDLEPARDPFVRMTTGDNNGRGDGW